MVETTDASKPSRWSRARSTVSTATATEGYSTPERKVYTLGTWRVSREVYLWQLSSLDVKLLVDVRGNPKAGREEQLFKGKDFTKALLTIGVRYEYWGDRLGEDQMCDGQEELQRVLKGLFASAPQGPICILGHMHEPHKCHRLHLCDLLPQGLSVQHLMWEDHRQTKSMSHLEAKTLYNRWVSYFNECLEREKQKRGSSSKWRRHSQHKRLGEAEAAALAKSLPVLSWESTSSAEWEERLRDGKAYRLRLPWDTEILWYPHFLTENEADELEDTVTEKITMYHPTYLFQTPSGVTQETVNRKGQARICDDFNFGIQYDSSRDKSMLYVSQKMEPWTRSLMHRIEDASESVFNAIWFNHYRDGTVTIHWHTDGNEGLGPDPIIGSLSIGATRDFAFKSKRKWHGLRPAKDGSMRKSSGIIHLTLPLFHGSLCVMGKNSQRHWLHAVPAMEGIRRERTNLTFRFWALEGFETIDDAEAHSNDAATKRQYRLRVVPSATLLQRMAASGAARCRPVIVDSPRDATLSVGEMLKRLQDHVLSPLEIEVVLALPEPVDRVGAEVGGNGGFEILQNDSVLLEELERLGLWPCQSACPVFTLQLLPVSSEKIAKAPVEDVKISDASSRNLGSAGLQLLREVKISCPGPYAPQAEVIDSRNWIQEVIQNLSGIQRKSKGKGRISQMVYHQCSEFCALYLARPKSSVHLVLTPKRPLRFNQLSATEAPLLRRLGLYGDLLREFLGKHRRTKVGLQTRKLSRDTQVFAHLLSMDLVAPDLSDLTKGHFLEFTGPGSTAFMSLEDLARNLEEGSTLGRSSNLEQDTLRCHRCGQLFGDSMRQLLLHLRRCEAPEFAGPSGPPISDASDASASSRSAVELLEEMGFRCGREALEDVLLHTKGSVERAVEFLSAQ